ncbi:MAG TPA: arginyltransferase [Polyangia bacterium]|nr:arginyltransferase [Polyangia bacterium]
MARTILSVIPPELVVHDEEDACPYLPDRRARRPLRQPLRRLNGAEFDQRLEAGDRRMGTLLYTQHCPTCVACEPIRIDVKAFAPTRAQRRAQAKGDLRIRAELGPLVVDEERVALYLKHERGRGLSHEGYAIDAEGYRRFLVDSCVDGFEIRYTVDQQLAAVAVVDRGQRALSAVYTFWDPDHAALSLGTYSILSQLGLARAAGLDWLYLGLAIAENPSMAYKMRFFPHERRIQGAWRRFLHE